MPTHPRDQDQKTAKQPASDELDPSQLDKVTGGLKSTGVKSNKTADPCEGGE